MRTTKKSPYLDYADSLARNHEEKKVIAYNMLPDFDRHGPLIRRIPPTIVTWFDDDGTRITVEIPR